VITRARSLFIATTLAAILTTACGDSTSPTQLTGLRASASGGTGGGGGISGGGGGGGTTTTSVVSYSNFGLPGAISVFEGWGATGVESTDVIGYFEDLSFQFSPTASGSITNLKLLVQKSFTNVGSDAYTVLLFTDNAAAPNTIGSLIGTFQGKAASLFATSAVSTISMSNGPVLQAGVNYWIRVVPALNSRVTWWAGAGNVYGWHFYEDLSKQYYWLDSATNGIGTQGAFEITVKQ
jgi:hypothetical protein